MDLPDQPDDLASAAGAQRQHHRRPALHAADVFHVFAALAEFERNLICERTLAGLKAAGARGRNGGRPKKLSPKELKTIRTLLRSNEVPAQDIAAQFKVNRSTLYRNVTAA